MRRIQPTMFGAPVVTYPRGKRLTQAALPGMDDPRAFQQLDADAVRAFLERLRAEALPELDDAPDLEG